MRTTDPNSHPIRKKTAKSYSALLDRKKEMLDTDNVIRCVIQTELSLGFVHDNLDLLIWTPFSTDLSSAIHLPILLYLLPTLAMLSTRPHVDSIAMLTNSCPEF